MNSNFNVRRTRLYQKASVSFQTITVTNTTGDGNTTTTIEQRTCDRNEASSVTTISLTSDGKANKVFKKTLKCIKVKVGNDQKKAQYVWKYDHFKWSNL